MKAENRGCLVISIDVAPEDGSEDSDHAPFFALQRLLDGYRIPATWAIADPGQSRFAPSLLAGTGRHEVAILGDAGWIGSPVGRTRFARELQRRVVEAREMDIPVSTLALRYSELPGHLDLLVKHKINMVRADAPAGGKGRLQVQPVSLRYGIWQAPTAYVVPQQESRWGWAATWPVKRAVERAIAGGHIVHLWIDSLSEMRLSLGRIESVVRHIARCRDRGKLAVRTLKSLAEALSPLRHAPQARSILRGAA